LTKSKLTVSFSGNVEKEFAVTDASGRVVFKGHTDTNTHSDVPHAVNVAAIGERLPLEFTQEDVYKVFSRCGIEYGPFHRKIVSMRTSEKEVLARLRPPVDDPAHWTRGYYLHPGILDSAFQATAGMLMAKMHDAKGEEDFPTMIPIGIESISIFKFLQGGEYYAHVTLDESTGGEANTDLMSCNICIYEPDGSPCVHVSKLQLKRISMPRSQSKPMQPHAVSEADKHKETAEFFHAVWKEQAASSVVTPGTSSRWLVFGSPNEIERQFAPALAEYGVDSLPVPFAHYHHADAAAIQEILDKAGSVTGVLFLGDYDTPPEDGNAADVATMRSLYSLIRAATTHARKNKDYQRIRLIRATRNAYRIGESDTAEIRKSLSTGFLRTARIEFPLMDIRQLELGKIDDSIIVPCLATELLSSGDNEDDGPETLYSNGKRYTLMVEPLNVNQQHERSNVFNHDKVFWIIGGTSGVGQVLARHIATNYRSALVLSGSRTLPEPSQYDKYVAEHQDGIASTIKFIREIEKLGSRVTYVSTDVRSADSLKQSLDTIRTTYGRLDGIYFGALQLDDKMILQKEWSGYKNMMDMRVNGVNELIRQTANDKVDFIVLFSSLAGITGNLGQSDYSASNVYMDHIPYVQHAGSKCRIITAQWGPWALGQQVSDIVLDSMRRNGFLHISAQLGMEALEKIVLGDQKNVAFVPGSEDARHIAININVLRKGLASKPKPKPQQTNAVKTVIEEDAAMANTSEIGRAHV
jgi:hypothetical protein